MYPKRPQEDIAELGSTWHLHPFLVENLLHAGQRPKLERYGDTPFFVIRSAWHVDDAEDVNFAEFHTLVRPRSVAVFCQDGRRIDVVDAEDTSGAADSDYTLLHDDRLPAARRGRRRLHPVAAMRDPMWKE